MSDHYPPSSTSADQGQGMDITELAKLRRETVEDAVLIDRDGNRTSGVLDVAVIPDGEHAGEPVTIYSRPPADLAAVEFGGRRFEWQRAGYWTETGSAT